VANEISQSVLGGNRPSDPLKERNSVIFQVIAADDIDNPIGPSFFSKFNLFQVKSGDFVPYSINESRRGR